MTGPVRRPGVVTFIGVVIYIQAVLAVIAAIVLFAFSTRLVRVISDITTEEVTSSGLLVAVIVAALLFYVGAGIMRGSQGVRAFVAVVEGLRMASALFAMLYYHDGAFVENGIVTILIGIFVLWALYGNDRSDAFFDPDARTVAIPAQAGPPRTTPSSTTSETPSSTTAETPSSTTSSSTTSS